MSHATGTCLRELTSYQLSVQYYMYEIFTPRLIWDLPKQLQNPLLQGIF